MRDDNPYSRLRSPQGPIQLTVVEDVPIYETVEVPSAPPSKPSKKPAKKSLFRRIKDFFETPQRIGK